MGQAWVRTVVVNGTRYVQAVEGRGGGVVRVLQSFGKYEAETWMKAQQFVASYNHLQDLGQPQQQFNIDELLKAGIAIFGLILGAKIVEELLRGTRILESPERTTLV
jgi:hypothetical protein